MGSMKVELLWDSSAEWQFCHKRCVDKQTRLEIRALWVQEEVPEALAQVRRVAQEANAAGMMTHSRSARELAKFNEMIARNI